LGPLLFLIYINDLPLNIQGAKLILYADDTNVLIVDKNEEALQTKLSLVTRQLEGWFSKNDLFINMVKTAAMSFLLCRSKPPFKPRILLRNTEVKYKSEVKFLGMRITGNLSFGQGAEFVEGHRKITGQRVHVEPGLESSDDYFVRC
jgi:hypothetical protein